MKRITIALIALFTMCCFVEASAGPRSRPRPMRHPAVGMRVRTIPNYGFAFHYNNLPYLYSNGVFYVEVSEGKYEPVKPEKGMLVPQLPEYNVEQVEIKGQILFLFDKTLYKQVPTEGGVQYQVVGFLDI